jgi:phosphoribosylformylglycinamidine cyclo-ligase
MVAIVSANKADEAIRILREHGETVTRIGRMAARAKGSPGCTVEGTAAWRA